MDSTTAVGHHDVPPGAYGLAAPQPAPAQVPAFIPAPVMRAGNAPDLPAGALAAIAGDSSQGPAPVVATQPRYIRAPVDFTPLGGAAYVGDLEQVVLLVRQGADVNAIEKRGAYGYTPLLAAVDRGHADIVRVLVSAGADVNLVNHGPLGFPLERAVDLGHEDIVRFLLEQPGILANPGSASFTPVKCAVWRGHLVIADMLFNRFPVSAGDLSSLLVHACEYRDIATVKFLQRRGGFSPGELTVHCCLHAAARIGRPEMIAYLLDYGVAADAVDQNGCTALEYACQSGSIAAVDMLLGHLRINLRVCEPASIPALLLIAVPSGNLKLLAYLLAAGADPNQQDRLSGRTALMAAAARGAIDVVRLLIASDGLKLDLRCHAGSTALELASVQCRTDIVACLLEAGATVEIPDDYPASLLHWAVSCADAALVRAIVEQYRCASVQTHAHCAAAQAHAAQSGCVAILENLLEWDHTVIGADNLATICWVPSVRTSHSVDIHRVLAAEADYARARAAGQGYQGKLAYDVKLYGLKEYLPCIAISDLMRGYSRTADVRLATTGPGTQPAPAQSLALLKQLIEAGTSSDSVGIASRDRLLRSLPLQSMLMTVALPVADCLTAKSRPLALMAGPGCTVNPRQTTLFYAAALNTLWPAVLKEEGARIYEAAGISARARERLGAVMQRDLDALATMTGQVNVLLGEEMLGNVLPACKEHTSGDYRVNVAALAAALLAHGLIGPLASAVAESWSKAVVALMGRPLEVPPGATFAQVAKLMDKALDRHGQANFAAILPGVLNKSDLLVELRKLTGASEEDQALHVLFQIQCDQLRQFCLQIGQD